MKICKNHGEYEESKCKQCNRDQQKRWRDKYPEESRRRSKAYADSHPEEVLDYKYRYKFGITLAEFRAMVEAQQHRCAICQTEIPGGRGDFHVDHDHETGIVRGLLCTRCNTGLGQFRDRPDLLEAAVKYLIARGAVVSIAADHLPVS